MSKRNTGTKNNKNVNNNNQSNKNAQNDKQYNVIINQNSTFNQDNSINIMLDGTFPYFQNYNYQSKETEQSNKIYPFYQDYNTGNNKDNEQNKNKENRESKKSKENKESKENNEETIKKKKSKKKKNIEKSPSRQKNDDKEKYEEITQRSTNKIDYRYMKKYPIKEIISTFKTEDNQYNTDKNEQLFWLATYGKLMKTKNLMKIFNYYNNKPFESQSQSQSQNQNNNEETNSNIKVKTLVVRDFEICFYENSNKPFIRYSKGGTIYTKLYLLTLKEISLIFSYINRIEYKIDYERLNYLQRKGNFEIINDNNNGIILPYCLIYSLGKYMNINIYSFSNNIDFNIYSDESIFQHNQRISSYTVMDSNINDNNSNYFSNDNHHHNKMNNTNIKSLNYKLPNSKKLAKLVKIINLNYPEFSIEDIINYLIPDNKYLNSITKIIEIKNIFFFKKSNQNKIILSSMVRDTIKGISIQSPQSLISSFCPCESILENNSFKNSDLFQPVTNKKYVFPIKDDYKFQTINTNEKDNNKNNPFIIYVCDNNNNNNFNFNENQPSFQINTNNISNINDNNNFKLEKENDEEIKYVKTETTIKKSKKHNLIRNNKCTNIYKSSHKIGDKKTNIERGMKKKSMEQIINKNTLLSNGNKKMKIQRISTDFQDLIKTTNRNNGGNENKKTEKKTREANLTNITNDNSNLKKKLNKSIEGHNTITSKYRLSKTSEINQRRKQNNNINNKMLINRMNLNKNFNITNNNNPFNQSEKK